MKKLNIKKTKKSSQLDAGLYVVATPIGNPQDVSEHAKQILSQCHVIAAEDTREIKSLFKKWDLEIPRTLAYHDHNEAESAPGVIALIQEGQAVALVTDAGTPAISDPGTRLVREAHKAKLKIFPIPGPSSLTAAVSVSGLGGGNFFFGGFLPSNQKTRLEILQKFQSIAQTLVFFEAPHRLHSSLQDIENIFGGENEICVCRELTKNFEEVTLQTVSEARNHFQVNEPRGEIVLVIKGRPEARFDAKQTKEKIMQLMGQGLSTSDILEALQPVSELTRKDLYNLIIHLKKI